MNVVVINLETKNRRYATFDLYAKDSTDLKAFLNQMVNGEVIIIASYDDAAFRLDSEARTILSSFGSSVASSIAFRDAWVFLGAKGVPGFSAKENHLKNDKVAVPSLFSPLYFTSRRRISTETGRKQSRYPAAYPFQNQSLFKTPCSFKKWIYRRRLSS